MAAAAGLAMALLIAQVGEFLDYHVAGVTTAWLNG